MINRRFLADFAGFGERLAGNLTWVSALAGTAMIIPLFMPSRWHGTAAEIEDYDDDYAATTAVGLVP